MMNELSSSETSSCQHKCLEKGIPERLLRKGRSPFQGVITTGILYRRSHKIESEQHWNQTRLGGISCNWSKYCQLPQDVLYDCRSNSDALKTEHKRVISCNLDANNEEFPENYPFSKVIEHDNNKLDIRVLHAPEECNYPHSNIDCFLTTSDGCYNESIVKPEEYNSHPLKKNLRGLRNKYKAHLIYHFSEFIDLE